MAAAAAGLCRARTCGARWATDHARRATVPNGAFGRWHRNHRGLAGRPRLHGKQRYFDTPIGQVPLSDLRCRRVGGTGDAGAAREASSAATQPQQRPRAKQHHLGDGMNSSPRTRSVRTRHHSKEPAFQACIASANLARDGVRNASTFKSSFITASASPGRGDQRESQRRGAAPLVELVLASHDAALLRRWTVINDHRHRHQTDSAPFSPTVRRP